MRSTSKDRAAGRAGESYGRVVAGSDIASGEVEAGGGGMRRVLWRLGSQLQPRDPSVAVRVVSVLAAIAVTVSVVFVPVVETKTGGSGIAVGIIVGIAMTFLGLISGARWIRRRAARRVVRQVGWALCPFLTLALIVTVDLATFDASLAAQIFLLFPALYGGTLLPRTGALLVTAATVICEVIVVTANLEGRAALVDAGYMCAALAATSFVLIQSTEREARSRAELQRSATTDALTGLVNRRAFHTAAEAALRSKRSQGAALVLLDVDMFKSFNDRYGHPGGDSILVQIAEVLTRAARDGDVVSRLGGDEMAVLMPNCSVDVARRRAQDFVAAVRAHGFVVGVAAVSDVSVSAGLAHLPTSTGDTSQLYEAADQALYQAKRGGRNQLITHQT